jgi:phage/plasmid-associated DNA primase
MTDTPQDNVVALRAVPLNTDRFYVPDNAQQIADMFIAAFYTLENGLKSLILYRKIFYAYNGICYKALEDGYIRDRLYNFLSDAYIRGSKGETRYKAKSSNISTIVECVASVVRLDQMTVLPFWRCYTHQPFPAERSVVFQNGILDMLSGRFIGSTPDLVALDCLDMDYDPNATWEGLEPLVKMCVFEDAIEAFQEAGGLTITKNMVFEKIFYALGPSRSGKGLLMSALRRCVGKGKYVSSTLQSLTKEFGLYSWRNALMATITELRLSRIADIQSALTKMLGVSGRDPMVVEGKRRDEETLDLETRIWIESNEVAGMPDATGAFVARLIIFRFKARQGEEDNNLKAMVAKHGPAFFNWFRAGYLRLMDRGKFIQPSSSRSIILRIRYEGDPMLGFFETRVKRVAGSKVLRAVLQHACEQWFIARKKPYRGVVSVGRKASELGIETYQDSKDGLRYYKDVELRDDEEYSDEGDLDQWAGGEVVDESDA